MVIVIVEHSITDIPLSRYCSRHFVESGSDSNFSPKLLLDAGQKKRQDSFGKRQGT